MDNVNDNKIFDDNYNKLVLEIAKGILKTLGISYKEDSSGSEDIFYRVVTGSFKNKNNADERVKQLKMKGFDSFIDVYRGWLNVL